MQTLKAQTDRSEAYDKEVNGQDATFCHLLDPFTRTSTGFATYEHAGGVFVAALPLARKSPL